MQIFNTTTQKLEEIRHYHYQEDLMSDLTAPDDNIRWNKDEERLRGD